MLKEERIRSEEGEKLKKRSGENFLFPCFDLLFCSSLIPLTLTDSIRFQAYLNDLVNKNTSTLK